MLSLVLGARNSGRATSRALKSHYHTPSFAGARVLHTYYIAITPAVCSTGYRYLNIYLADYFFHRLHGNSIAVALAAPRNYGRQIKDEQASDRLSPLKGGAVIMHAYNVTSRVRLRC